MDHSMISVEEIIEDSIVPIESGVKTHASIVPISGGVKTHASIDTQVVPSQSGGNPLREKSSSSAGANLMAEENAHLRQELDAVRFQLGETKHNCRKLRTTCSY